MKLKLLSCAGFLLCAIGAIADPSTPGTSASANKSHTTPKAVTQFSIGNDPEVTERIQETTGVSLSASQAGFTALEAGNYAAAEQDFRSSLSADLRGEGYLGLGESLAAQGKTADAMQAYWSYFNPPAPISWGGSFMTRANLEYALLLFQNGQWAQAVAHYQAALPQLSQMWWNGTPVAIQFDPAVPQPTAFEAAVRICLGLDANSVCNMLGDYDNKGAFAEYSQALQLEPGWDVANYYYNYGWQRLDTSDQTRLLNAQQAKAALQKALRIGKGDVKKAAQKALKGA